MEIVESPSFVVFKQQPTETSVRNDLVTHFLPQNRDGLDDLLRAFSAPLFPPTPPPRNDFSTR